MSIPANRFILSLLCACSEGLGADARIPACSFGNPPGPWIPCESTNTGRGRQSGNTRHYPQPSIRRPSSGNCRKLSPILIVHLTQSFDEVEHRHARLSLGFETGTVRKIT